MSQFRDAYDEFRRQNIEVAGMSVDSPYAHRVFAEQIDLPYPLLSDFAREVGAAYGVPFRDLAHLGSIPGRSAFLIDAARTIRYAWREQQRGLPPLPEILEAMEELEGEPETDQE